MNATDRKREELGFKAQAATILANPERDELVPDKGRRKGSDDRPAKLKPERQGIPKEVLDAESNMGGRSA